MASPAAQAPRPAYVPPTAVEPDEQAPTVDDAGPEQPGRERSSRRVRRVLALAAIALVVIEIVIVAPEIGSAVEALRTVDLNWVGVAVLATAVSMSMFGLGRRRLLAAAGVRTSAGASVAAAFVANALHVTLPGGAAFSTAYTYRWMRVRGATVAVSTWVLVAGGVLATGSLLAMGLAGALLAGQRGGLLGGALELGGILLAALLVRHLIRHPRLIRAACMRVLAGVNRLRRREPAAGAAALDDLVVQLQAVRPRPTDWFASGGYALANWAFDMACLAACAAALQVHGLTLALLLVTYTAGMATSGLSPLPGGIGVVDATLVLALTAGGVPVASALPVVVLYRLISVLGTVAVGWLLYVAEQVRPAPSALRPPPFHKGAPAER